MTKRVYVVRGSEDGNIGVYGNAKRAVEAAARYLTQAGDCPGMEFYGRGTTPCRTAMDLIRDLKTGRALFGSVYARPEMRGTCADIEVFDVE